MQSFSLEVIGTHLRLEIDTPLSCDELFRVIEMRLSAFEKKFSRFIPDNWLDTLNRERKGQLDEDGRVMLEYALQVARDTGGYFDPTVSSTLSSLGYGRAEQGGHTVSYEQVKLDGYDVTLGGDVIVEFGGVGKGYLIDVIKSIVDMHFQGSLSSGAEGTQGMQSKDLLENRENDRADFSTSATASARNDKIVSPKYIIDFGGDIYAHGGWNVGLENPHNLEEVIGTITLDDDFLACSSGSKRKWGSHHHLINPKTGESAREVIATFIEGKSGISTDSYATALAVMPFLEACEILFRNPDIEGIIMAEDGRYFRSPGSKSEVFSE